MPRLDLAVSPFDGNKKNFQTFLRSLQLQFLGNQVLYTTDLNKILFVLSKIIGDGFTSEWANMKADEILNTGVVGTWEGFVEELRRAFDNPNITTTALNDIAKLKQGPLEATEFFAQFETLMRKANLDTTGDSDFLVHWLELNLNRQLTTHVYGVNPMPVNYIEWKALVKRLDTQQRRLDAIVREQNAGCPALPQPQQLRVFLTPHYPNPTPP